MGLRVFIVSAFLTLLLAVSNTYLALKVGFLTAASIPAAILSMGILKFAKNSSLFEHNLIQTAASSGEAIAGGIAYTVPALLIIGFWSEFNYWENVLLALVGGVIGVLFSTLVRRPLLQDGTLKFPEGQAIAEVLKLKEKRVLGLREIVEGSLLGALVEFCQSTRLFFQGTTQFVVQKGSLFGFGIGVTPALIGAGYLVGFRVGLSLLLGLLIAYVGVLPYLSHPLPTGIDLTLWFNTQYAMPLRYVGVGAMLLAALLTLLRLLRPILRNLKQTLGRMLGASYEAHDQDLSSGTVVLGLFLSTIALVYLLQSVLNLTSVGFSTHFSWVVLGVCTLYILIIGFIMTLVCGYFSGLVGVSASPGSSVMLGGMILAAVLVHALFVSSGISTRPSVLFYGEVVTIVVSSIVMQIAAISNDTLQDLKVGQLIKASPRQQQVMLIFGVALASLVVPAVMQVLYLAYGIAGHVPQLGMDPNNTLAAPPANIMATLTEGVFKGDIPWKNLILGAEIMAVIWVCSLGLSRMGLELTLLGVGVGMYLPLSASTPLVLGSLLAGLMSWIRRKRFNEAGAQRNLLLACGLVTGASLIDVLLAIPMALNPGGEGLTFHISNLGMNVAGIFAVMVIIGLFVRQSLARSH